MLKHRCKSWEWFADRQHYRAYTATSNVSPRVHLMDTPFRCGGKLQFESFNSYFLFSNSKKQCFNGNVAVQKTANATKFERIGLHPSLLK